MMGGIWTMGGIAVIWILVFVAPVLAIAVPAKYLRT